MQTPATFDAIYSPLHPYSTKNLNKRVILDMVRFSQDGVSRADLARQMDLTRAAVTSIVNDLIQDGLVRETEAVVDQVGSAGGRPPIRLEINPRRSTVLGVDMASTHLTIVLANFAGQTLREVELPFNIKHHPEACLQEVDRQIRRLIDQAGISFDGISAVVIAVPGPVDVALGGVCAPPIMPGWDGIPIRDILCSQWNVPVSIGNDAEYGALGEWAYGAGRGLHNLAYIKVGSGVGAGLLLDGHIYRGATGCAGEIGHITIQENGPLCSCGNHGCLEALTGGNAVAAHAREAVKAGRDTLLAAIQPPETIAAWNVIELAQKGDQVAMEIIADAGSYLGIAIASMVNLFNPEMVVVGGGVSQAGDLLLNPVRQAVQLRSLRSAAEAVSIKPAVLGNRSTSTGAVVQAIDLALDQLTDR